MTSKEIIKEEIKFLKNNLEKAKKEKVVIAIKQIEEVLEQKEQVLKDLEVLEILKPRIKLKESSLKNIRYNFDEQGNIIMEQDLKETPVVFIQSSGFVFKNSAEHKALKRWLNNDK